jgi:hypothetical protein
MGRLEEASFATGYVILTFFAICLAVAVFASSAAQNYPLYVVKPNSCDSSKKSLSIVPYFQGNSSTDASTWVWADWLILPQTGFCPLQRRDDKKAAGGSPTANYEYDDCIKFRTAVNWEGSSSDKKWNYIDGQNGVNGYSTSFNHDARKFYSSGALSSSATVFLWIWLVGTIAGYWYPVAVAVAVASLPLVFALWLGALGTVRGTDFLDEVAWTKYFFYSCTVDVVRGRAYALGGYCVVTSGSYLIMYTLLILQYYLKSGGGYFNAEKSLTDFHTVLIKSPWATAGPAAISEPAKDTGMSGGLADGHDPIPQPAQEPQV